MRYTRSSITSINPEGGIIKLSRRYTSTTVGEVDLDLSMRTRRQPSIDH